MRKGTPGFVPERLIQAREARGLIFRKSLADLIGVNSSTVGRWEDGSSSPEPKSLWEIAQKLDVRPEFFLRPLQLNTDAHFYRSMASSLKRDKAIQQGRMTWLQEISLFVQKYVDFPTVNLPDVLNGDSYKQLRGEDIERIASALRDYWDLGDGPIIDMIGLLEKVGYVVSTVFMDTSRLDGMCQWGPDGRPYILLANDKMSYARRQMDAAHEMAHGLLHRNVSSIELKENFKFIENQAFRLASAFLLPQSSYPLEIDKLTLAELELKKHRWRISIKAQIRRLKDLKIIDDDYYVHMSKIYSGRKWRGTEPLDRVWELEKPKLLKQAFEAIVEHRILEKSEIISKHLTLNKSDIENLSGLKEGWFGSETGKIIRLREQLPLEGI